MWIFKAASEHGNKANKENKIMKIKSNSDQRFIKDQPAQETPRKEKKGF